MSQNCLCWHVHPTDFGVAWHWPIPMSSFLLDRYLQFIPLLKFHDTNSSQDHPRTNWKGYEKLVNNSSQASAFHFFPDFSPQCPSPGVRANVEPHVTTCPQLLMSIARLVGSGWYDFAFLNIWMINPQKPKESKPPPKLV